jgi:hypothetical protein
MISLLRRTIPTILILSATAAVACACGGGRAATDAAAGSVASASTGPTSTVGSDSPASPGAKVSKGTLELGEAINLSHSDVPGMMQVLPPSEAPGRTRAAHLCGRAASLIEESGAFRSAEFTRGAGRHLEAVRSAVRLAPSAEAAARHAAAGANASFLACYERFLRNATHGTGAGPVALSVSALPSPVLPGVSASFASRVMKRPSFPKAERFPVYVDFVGFASGRVEVALAFISGAQPFPAATEHRLVSALLSRAKANEP